jgi:hypothetical protein
MRVASAFLGSPRCGPLLPSSGIGRFTEPGVHLLAVLRLNLWSYRFRWRHHREDDEATRPARQDEVFRNCRPFRILARRHTSEHNFTVYEFAVARRRKFSLTVFCVIANNCRGYVKANLVRLRRNNANEASCVVRSPSGAATRVKPGSQIDSVVTDDSAMTPLG